MSNENACRHRDELSRKHVGLREFPENFIASEMLVRFLFALPVVRFGVAFRRATCDEDHR